MGWANRITLLRALMMAGVWVVLIVDSPTPSPTSWWIAFVLFVLTAVTDVVDGAIARHLGEVTVFGRIADPLVDKLLILGTMVVVLSLDGIRDVMPAWAVVLILTRELVVTALRGAVEGMGISFQAMPLGKLKMLLQSITVGATLLWGAGFPLARARVPGLADLLGGQWSLTYLLVWVTVVVTVLSGIDYGLRAARHLRGA